MKDQEMEKAAGAGTPSGLQNKSYSVERVTSDTAKTALETSKKQNNSNATIRDYANVLADHATFPPVTGFYDVPIAEIRRRGLEGTA